MANHCASRFGFLGHASLPVRTGAGLVNVIIDMPKGSRNKFKFDEHAECFRLSRILPVGASFSHDFGSIPGTLAEDGDPLDVVVIAEDHGRHFRPTGHGGPDEAQRMLGAAEQRFKKTRE